MQAAGEGSNVRVVGEVGGTHNREQNKQRQHIGFLGGFLLKLA